MNGRNRMITPNPTPQHGVHDMTGRGGGGPGGPLRTGAGAAPGLQGAVCVSTQNSFVLFIFDALISPLFLRDVDMYINLMWSTGGHDCLYQSLNKTSLHDLTYPKSNQINTPKNHPITPISPNRSTPSGPSTPSRPGSFWWTPSSRPTRSSSSATTSPCPT